MTIVYVCGVCRAPVTSSEELVTDDVTRTVYTCPTHGRVPVVASQPPRTSMDPEQDQPARVVVDSTDPDQMRMIL